jgi:hypothetical protein
MANTLVSCGNPIMAALAVGFSCGTVCSPLVNLFLTTYAMGRFNNMRQGMRAFGYFWGGKTAIVVGSAFLSAILGKAIIGRNGKIFSFNSSLILDICMILTGVLLLAGMFFGRRKAATCSACNVSCQHFDGGIRPKGIMPLVVMGAANDPVVGGQADTGSGSVVRPGFQHCKLSFAVTDLSNYGGLFFPQNAAGDPANDAGFSN